MNISDFQSSQDLKKLTHELASHSKGKIKAGQLQNALASMFNFTHPKEMFNHLDGIYNRKFKLCISNNGYAYIEFMNSENKPIEYENFFKIDGDNSDALLVDFLQKTTNNPFSNFVCNLESALKSLFTVFDLSALKRLNDEINITTLLNQLAYTGGFASYTTALDKLQFFEKINKVLVKCGDMNIINQLHYIDRSAEAIQDKSPVIIYEFIRFVLDQKPGLSFDGKSPEEQASEMSAIFKELAIRFMLFSLSKQPKEIDGKFSYKLELKLTKEALSKEDLNEKMSLINMNAPEVTADMFHEDDLRDTIASAILYNRFEKAYQNAHAKSLSK